MKQQIGRLSPHQNAKVFGVLFALGALVFVLPLYLIFALSAPAEARPPVYMLLVMPLMYLVFGYLLVGAGCLLYNFMFKYIGGFEFEAKAGAD